MRYFMGISWDTQSPASACLRLPHIAEVASGNADATDESREPGIVADPVPRSVHFEVHQPWGSFGEGQVEARERLLALANLRVQPCKVQGRHGPLPGEGRETAACAVSMSFCVWAAASACVPLSSIESSYAFRRTSIAPFTSPRRFSTS